MNNVVQRIADISVANTWKAHDLLDKTLKLQNINFPDNEIRFDTDRNAFITELGEYRIVVIRDLNTFAVASRLVKGDAILAECVVTVNGGYDERYNRIDPDVKTRISSWFTELSKIDTTHLQDQYIGTEENIPDDIPTEPEKVEAEIVSEG